MLFLFVFFFTDPATPEIYTLSLHDALPIRVRRRASRRRRELARPVVAPGGGGRSRPAAGHPDLRRGRPRSGRRSEEHTSELQSLRHLVCRLLLEKKKKKKISKTK